MAKRKPKTAREVNEIEIVTTESISLESFVAHYAALRFHVWDGSDRVSHKPYYVFEMVPGVNETAGTKKSTKFDTLEKAEEFATAAREKLRETITKSIMEAFLDGSFKEPDSGSV